MGMSTHVIGFKPADEKWLAMKKIWDSCCELNIKIPTEVDDFFEGEPPSDSGVQVDLYSCVSAYEADMEEGYEVDVTKLPKDVTIIRFCNSY